MMKLTRHIKLTALLIAAVTAQATAQKCKGVYSQKDPFKGITIYNSQMPLGPIWGGWTFILRQEGPKYMIGIGEQNGQNTTDRLPKGSKFEIMFASGQKVEIVTTKDYESTPLKIEQNMYTQWVVCEEVSKETFTKFSESTITALKTTFKFKGETREFVLPGIKDRQGERIMSTAACMLGN